MGADPMDEVDALREELEHYKAEKERIRDVIGQIGGRARKRHDMTINVAFATRPPRPRGSP